MKPDEWGYYKRLRWAHFTLAVCLALALVSHAAATDLRIRVSWGGGAERLWSGTAAVTDGSLSEPTPLGIEADEPGSMWLVSDPAYVHRPPADLLPEDARAAIPPEHLVIRQRSPRTYDAVDMVVSSKPGARLLVELVAADEPDKPHWSAIPLAELLEGASSRTLDDRGNSLLVQRRPDDDLRVELKRSSLVFSPKEVFEFDLSPYMPALESGTALRITTELVPARGSQALWSADESAVAGQAAPIREKITLPDQEGAYDVVITARHASGLR